MRIAGNYNFSATQEEVWSALNDPEVLARAIPGCQKLEQVGDHEFESTLKIGLQAVKGVYNGRVKIEDLQPPHHYRIVIDGKGSNGFLKGEGSVDLREDGDITIMDYGGEAQVGGAIASVGQRLLDGAAKTLINQSLKALKAQIEARISDSAQPTIADTSPSDAHTADNTPSNGVHGSVVLPEVAATPATEPHARGPGTSVLSRPETTTATVAAPPSPPVAPATPPTPNQAFERRNIVVPEHERLTETHVARGVIADFLQERPWFPWVALAFCIGYLLGRNRKR